MNSKKKFLHKMVKVQSNDITATLNSHTGWQLVAVANNGSLTFWLFFTRED